MFTKDEIMSPYDKSIQRPQQVQNHLPKRQRTSRGKNKNCCKRWKICTYTHVASQGGMVEYNLVEGNMYNENSDGENAIEEGED